MKYLLATAVLASSLNAQAALCLDVFSAHRVPEAMSFRPGAGAEAMPRVNVQERFKEMTDASQKDGFAAARKKHVLARGQDVKFVETPDPAGDGTPRFVAAHVLKYDATSGAVQVTYFREYKEGGKLRKRKLIGVLKRGEYQVAEYNDFVNMALSGGEKTTLLDRFKAVIYGSKKDLYHDVVKDLNGQGQPAEVLTALMEHLPQVKAMLEIRMGTYEVITGKEHSVNVAEEALKALEGRGFDAHRPLVPGGKFSLRAISILESLKHDIGKGIAAARTGRGNQDLYNPKIMEAVLRDAGLSGAELKLALAIYYEKSVLNLVFDQVASYMAVEKPISVAETVAALKKSHEPFKGMITLKEFTELVMAFSYADSVGYGDRKLKTLVERAQRGELNAAATAMYKDRVVDDSYQYFDRTQENSQYLEGYAISADHDFVVPLRDQNWNELKDGEGRTRTVTLNPRRLQLALEEAVRGQ